MGTRAPSDSQSRTFKTFPEFSKLRLEDKSAYEALIRDYPPLSEIAFSSLMQWWNQLGSLAISLLNGNLIISYWLPGDDRRSGLSILGTSMVDESMCILFDYLREQGERPRLVHVPEFMMGYMQHPELFSFDSERTLDEYVVPMSKFYPLNNMVSFRRHHVRKFLENVDEQTVSIHSLDLTDKENQDLLLDAVARWPKKGTVNNPSKLSEEAMYLSVLEAERLGIENVCLFVGNTLHGFLLYSLPSDKRYAILSQAKLSYELPRLFDYMVYAFARWFAEKDIIYMNLSIDFGVPMLRMIKLALGPQNFFRKYTVEPAK